MTVVFRTALAGVVLTAAAAATAGAQGAAAAKKPQCEINTSSPFQVNGARVYLNKATATTGKADEKPQHLKSAIAALEPADKISNKLGRSWVLGQALLAWTTLPGRTGTTAVRRGDVGFTVNPGATIDLLAAADTALTYVEQNAPNCVEVVRSVRQQAWVPLINAANTAANAKQLDSAEALAKRSLEIYRDSPYAYQTLAIVAQNRNDEAGARDYYKQVVDKSVGDTTAAVRDMRKQALYNYAVLTQNSAEDATDAAKKAELNKQAIEVWRTYLKEYPGDTNAQSAMARALNAVGDTAAAAGVTTSMLADPSKYNDMQLFEAGTAAARAQRTDDAVKLFEAGLVQNPYHRDALFNLATTYFRAGKADETLRTAQRLVAIDPNNPDNWRLVAGAYQLRAADLTDAKQKKAATDSLLATMKKVGTIGARVGVTSFERGREQATLSGTIENLGAAAATYPLKVEFLDKGGSVVATSTTSVGPVAPKATQSFTVTGKGANIIGFRYAPLK